MFQAARQGAKLALPVVTGHFDAFQEHALAEQAPHLQRMHAALSREVVGYAYVYIYMWGRH